MRGRQRVEMEDEKSVFTFLRPASVVFAVLMDISAFFLLDKEKLGFRYYLIVGAVSIIALACFFWMLVHIIKNRKQISRRLVFHFAPKGSLILLNKTCTYTFVDRTHMTYRKDFNIKSRIQDLRSFYDMYMWTKDYQKQTLQPINSDTLADTFAEDQWQFYGIRFDEACGKNKVHETGIFMPSLEDPDKKSQLFLSTGIFEPTVSVSLRVVIKNGLQFKENSAFCNIYHYYYGITPDQKIPLDVIEIPQDEGGGYQIFYSTKYPIKGARYKLVWKFKGE